MARGGQGDAKGHSRLAKPPHSRHDAIEHALAAPLVCALAPTLYRDRRRQVARPSEALRHRVVDQGAIGVGEEKAVIVLFDQVEDALALRAIDKGLSAGKDKEPRTPQRLGLRDDLVQDRPVQLFRITSTCVTR